MRNLLLVKFFEYEKTKTKRRILSDSSFGCSIIIELTKKKLYKTEFHLKFIYICVRTNIDK